MSNVLGGLGKLRKARARAEDRAQADANAARHGLSKAERLLEAARSEQARKMLDRHKTEDDG